MLRGIHKASSNWIGRAVMGVVLGLIAISFAHLGHRRHFPRLRPSTRSPRSAAPRSASSSSASSTRTGCSSSAARCGRPITARPGAGAGPRPAAARRSDRARPRSTSARASCGSTSRMPRSREQITDDAAFQGPQRPVRPRALRADHPRTWATPRRGSSPSSGDARCASRSRRRSAAILPVPKAALTRSTVSRTRERDIDYVALGPAQAGDIPTPTPEELDEYFEEHKACSARPSIARSRCDAHAGRTRRTRIEITDADAEGLLRAAQGALRHARERRHSSRSCSRTWRRPRPPPTELAQGTTSSARRPSAGSRTATSISALVAKTADRRSRRRRRRVRAQVRRGQRAGSGPVRHRCSSRSSKIEPGEDRARSRRSPPSSSATCRPSAPSSELTNVQDKIEDERAGGATLADAAQKFNLKPRTIEAIDRTGKDAEGNPVPDLPQSVDVLAVGLRRRRPRRERAAAGAEHGGYRLVRRRAASRRRATGRSTRSRTRSWRAGATTKSRHGSRPRPTRCWTSSRPARRSRMSPPATSSRSESGRASSAASRRRDLPPAVVQPCSRRRRTARHRRGRQTRPNGSCFRDRRQGDRRSSPSRDAKRQLDDALKTRYGEDLIGAISGAPAERVRRQHQSRRR